MCSYIRGLTASVSRYTRPSHYTTWSFDLNIVSCIHTTSPLRGSGYTSKASAHATWNPHMSAPISKPGSQASLSFLTCCQRYWKHSNVIKGAFSMKYTCRAYTAYVLNFCYWSPQWKYLTGQMIFDLMIKNMILYNVICMATIQNVIYFVLLERGSIKTTSMEDASTIVLEEIQNI